MSMSAFCVSTAPLLAVDQRLGREHVGFRLIERDSVVAVVDTGQDLPRFKTASLS